MKKRKEGARMQELERMSSEYGLDDGLRRGVVKPDRQAKAEK